MKIFALVLIVGLSARAEMPSPMEILNGHQAIKCAGEDNIYVVLNAQHTWIKYSVEGESIGPMRIEKVSTDHKTYVSYINSEGWLTFNARGSYYRLSGEQQSSMVNCRVAP